MPQLRDVDLKGIHNLDIVEFGNRKYVSLTCLQIAVLLSEENPYHEKLHIDVLKYDVDGIGIGYTEDVRASVEKFLGFDLSEKKHIEKAYPLAAPMLNSWDLIEPDGAKLE